MSAGRSTPATKVNPTVSASAGSTPPDSDTPVRSRAAIDRIIGLRDIHVRGE